jgi:hypothetical protein
VLFKFDIFRKRISEKSLVSPSPGQCVRLPCSLKGPLRQNLVRIFPQMNGIPGGSHSTPKRDSQSSSLFSQRSFIVSPITYIKIVKGQFSNISVSTTFLVKWAPRAKLLGKVTPHKKTVMSQRGSLFSKRSFIVHTFCIRINFLKGR